MPHTSYIFMIICHYGAICSYPFDSCGCISNTHIGWVYSATDQYLDTSTFTKPRRKMSNLKLSKNVPNYPVKEILGIVKET